MIIEKCPNCGEMIKSNYNDICPACNIDLTKYIPPITGRIISKVKPFLHAFQLYTIYWLTTFIVIKSAFSYTLFYEDAKEYLESGIISIISDYGWADHYIWFLIVVCIVSFISAFLCGATTKRFGGLFSAISNIPIGILFSIIAYLAVTDQIPFESPSGWNIILPISTLASFVCAYIGGHMGQIFQAEGFDKNTVLGIRPIHWLWIWLFWGGYIFCLTQSIIRVSVVIWSAVLWSGFFIQQNTFNNMTLCALILLVIISVLAYSIPTYLMYKLLRFEPLKNTNKIFISLSFIATYLFVFAIAIGIEWLSKIILHFISGVIGPT